MKRLAPLGLVLYFVVFGVFFGLIIFGTLSLGAMTTPKPVALKADRTHPAVPATRSTTATVTALPTATATATPTPVPPTPTVLPTATATPVPPTPTPTPLPLYFNNPAHQVVKTDPIFDLPPFVNFVDRFQYQKNDQVTQLRPGIVQINRTTYGNNPLRTHIFLFDLNAPELSLSVAVQNDYFGGVAPTSKIAASHKALVGVNGDLFGGTGLPEGLTIFNSQVAIAPKHRATFAWSNTNQPFIGYFTQHWTWDSQVIAGNNITHTLQLLNTPCKSGELCIYNDLYAGMPYHQGDVKVLLDPNNVVVGITRTISIKIPDHYQVLWGLGETATWLLQNIKLGQTVKIDINTNVPLDNYKYAVGGGPIILKDGQFNQDCLCDLEDCTGVATKYRGSLCEEFTLDWKLTHYLDVQMPRIGVGFDKDKKNLIVIEVDGYQPGFSVGIRQDDFAKLFQEFGADTAMELDGGGSATMWANGKLVSRPSDGGGYVERWVPDALLFNWNQQFPATAASSSTP